MADYASNTPISWPIKINDVVPDVDLGGVQFSYQYGLIYNPESQPSMMRTPVTGD